jgi:hypothetical protein
MNSAALQKTETAVSVRREQAEPMSIGDMMTMAEMFVKSGMFGDVRDIAKAFVKIQAGREIGVPPFAAMRGVSIIQGQAALGATLVAGRMKAHGYDWEEVRRDNEACELRIIKPNGKVAGISGYSMKDAAAAGLQAKDNWKKYPKAMLFARCITDAARTWAPEVFSGIPVYTQEELGRADTDLEQGEDAKRYQDATLQDGVTHREQADVPLPVVERKPAVIANAPVPSLTARQEIERRIAELKTECEFYMQQRGLEAFADLLRQHGVADENSFKTHGAARKFIAELDAKLENLRHAPAAAAEDRDSWIPDFDAVEEPANV